MEQQSQLGQSKAARMMGKKGLLYVNGWHYKSRKPEFTFQMYQNNPCPHQLAIKKILLNAFFSSQFSRRLKIKEKIDVIYPLIWQEQRNQIHDLMGRVDGHWSVYYCRKPPAGWVKSHHPWWPPPWHSEVTPLTTGAVGRSCWTGTH